MKTEPEPNPEYHVRVSRSNGRRPLKHTLIADIPMEPGPLTEADKVNLDKDAETILEFLTTALPCGTFDRLLLKMEKFHASS